MSKELNMNLSLTAPLNVDRKRLSYEELASLTVEELALAIAIKQYQGVSVPTTMVAQQIPHAPMHAVADPLEAVRAAGLPEVIAKMRKRCPRCGRTGQVDAMFGPRWARTKWVPQSHCRTCRGSKTPAK